jgi:hypothetical protein
VHHLRPDLAVLIVFALQSPEQVVGPKLLGGNVMSVAEKGQGPRSTRGAPDRAIAL